MENNWTGGNRFLSWNEAQHNATLIFNELRSWGYSVVACCAWLGNMWVESTLNPQIWQNLFPHDDNGIGINQWTRAPMLFNRQVALGYSARSLNGDQQLDVMKHEMSLQIPGLVTSRPQSVNWVQWINQPSENIFHQTLWTTTSVDEATRQILRGYYRAGAPALARRQQYARRFLDIFRNHTSQPEPPQAPNQPGGNYQLAVVPLRHAPGQFINIVQGEMSGHSHQGIVAMDFQSGWGTAGWNMPLHAPVDMVCVATETPNAIAIWDTVTPVRWVDGTIDHFSMAIIHDNILPSVGRRVIKDEIIGRAGTAGFVQSWGHAHIQFRRGRWEGWPLNSPSWRNNAVSMARVCSLVNNLTGQRMDLRALTNLRPNNGSFPTFNGIGNWNDNTQTRPPSGQLPSPNPDVDHPETADMQSTAENYWILRLLGVLP